MMPCCAITGGVWVGPTRGRSLKLDFPSAKFWVKIFFFLDGWVSEPNDLPLSYKQSLVPNIAQGYPLICPVIEECTLQCFP